MVANPALLKLKNFGITVMPTTEITAKEKLETVKKEQTAFYDEEKPLMVIDYTHTDFADFPAELRLLSGFNMYIIKSALLTNIRANLN